MGLRRLQNAPGIDNVGQVQIARPYMFVALVKNRDTARATVVDQGCVERGRR